jgi:hypothetical protein
MNQPQDQDEKGSVMEVDPAFGGFRFEIRSRVTK